MQWQEWIGSSKVTLSFKAVLLLWKYYHPEVFSIADFNILTMYTPNKPTGMSEH